MYYSEEDINNILSKNDIVEIIGKHVSLLKKSEKYIESDQTRRNKTVLLLPRMWTRWKCCEFSYGIVPDIFSGGD